MQIVHFIYARGFPLSLQLVICLICSVGGNAEVATQGQNRATRPTHTMFAGRSVERLVPVEVLPKSETAWACETKYRLIGPDMTVGNKNLQDAVKQTWIKLNSVPNLKLQINITNAALAEGTQEHRCGLEDDQEECFRLSEELAANYRGVDIYIRSGLVRSTQFPEIGEKEWTYNRMLETSLRDRGVTGRVVSLHLKALPEGVHVIKYLPLTPLYAEETMFQLYGRELLPFDAVKQNALYASLDLIGLNSLAGVGWVEILSISEAWHWKPLRGDVGVANITMRTKRERAGRSMGETLTMQLPRLLDRLDEIGLRRVDGEVLWSRVVSNQSPQDQIAGYLSPDDPVRAYDQRESSATIPPYPLKQERSTVWSLFAGVAGGLILLAFPAARVISWRRRQRQAVRSVPHQFNLPQPQQLGPLKVPLATKLSGLRTIPSIPSPNLPAFGSMSPLAKTSASNSASNSELPAAEINDTFNPFKKQRSKPSNSDLDINTLGDSATETAGLEGVSEARRRANIQAELEKAHSLKGWEIPLSAISICTKEDGSEWLLGHGGFGEVYKGLKSGVTDVAVKVLTYTEELEMQQFWVEINLLKSLSFHNNIVQFYGVVIDAANPMLVLELMEGGDLRSALSGPLAGYNSWYNNGRVLAMDIVRGVFYLHDNKVIHGDLKSKNILLSRNCGTAKLSDVGMARFLASTVATGDSRQSPPGTFAYAAPELLLGQRCTLQADIFSLGVTLWEICTCQIPVRGQMRALEVPDDCPQAISDLIGRCMQPTPGDRPTAMEVFQALKAAEEPFARTTSSASSGALPSRLSVQRMQRAMME